MFLDRRKTVLVFLVLLIFLLLGAISHDSFIDADISLKHSSPEKPSTGLPTTAGSHGTNLSFLPGDVCPSASTKRVSSWSLKDDVYDLPELRGSLDITTLQPGPQDHLVFIGDSVLRYFYLTYVMALEYGGNPREALRPRELPRHINPAAYDQFHCSRQPTSRPCLRQVLFEKTWSGWMEFFAGTTYFLNDHETCDCYRVGRDYETIRENREYTSPVTGGKVSFFLWLGKPIKRHGNESLDVIQFLRRAVPSMTHLVMHFGLHPWPHGEEDENLAHWLVDLLGTMNLARQRLTLWTTSVSSKKVGYKMSTSPNTLARWDKVFQLAGKSAERTLVNIFDVRNLMDNLARAFKTSHPKPFFDAFHVKPSVNWALLKLFSACFDPKKMQDT